MKPMDKYDQPLLSAAGFDSGWSGHSWFCPDRHGVVWQAWLDDKSVFQFRNEQGGKWGPTGPLAAADFRKLFALED